VAKVRKPGLQRSCGFGQKRKCDFDGDLAVLGGRISQGKTSFCVAVELLLTGTTVRRELTAGS
jgi:hypothetical protein